MMIGTDLRFRQNISARRSQWSEGRGFYLFHCRLGLRFDQVHQVWRTKLSEPLQRIGTGDYRFMDLLFDNSAGGIAV